jgi:hypothetical protein
MSTETPMSYEGNVANFIASYSQKISQLNLMDVLILGDRPNGGSSDKIPQGFGYIEPWALGITASSLL